MQERKAYSDKNRGKDKKGKTKSYTPSEIGANQHLDAKSYTNKERAYYNDQDAFEKRSSPFHFISN